MITDADLIRAVQSGNVEVVRSLLNESPPLASAKDENGVSALMYAFYYRQPAVADCLLAAKSELDIFEATAAERSDRVSEILERDPGAANRFSPDGFTALHFAAFFNRPDIARDLIRHGADVRALAKNAMKVTPLHSAAAAHSREIVRLLLEHGAPADAQQQGGWTALHAAAQYGDMEMVRDLLQHGAGPLLRNDDGKSPADLAEAKGHKELLKLLASSIQTQH
ncbi:MAG: ankyrin repeat domain-containing protein [Acidobacteria bacterium]|nr:ankyrin repeat domain-containing protein [Acidobacteriota bacterium]